MREENPQSTKRTFFAFLRYSLLRSLREPIRVPYATTVYDLNLKYFTICK
jgi:hypothetical protein